MADSRGAEEILHKVNGLAKKGVGPGKIFKDDQILKGGLRPWTNLYKCTSLHLTRSQVAGIYLGKIFMAVISVLFPKIQLLRNIATIV